MNKKTLTFAALVIALSLETVDAFEKEFNHSGVIQKGLTYDDVENTTSFRYKDANGITKWYTIEGEIPSEEIPSSFSATVVVLNGDSEIDAFEKEFKHTGVIQKGITVDEAVNTTTFRYCDEKGIIKPYTITGTIPVLETSAEKPAAAKKAVKAVAKKAVAKKAVKAVAKKAVAKKAVAKKAVSKK